MRINPEKRLQDEAIAWLKTHRGYREVFSDIEARGARMDSAGSIDDQLVLIEVKPCVNAELTTLGPDGANKIECKISETLRQLYRRSHSDLAIASNTIWNRRRPALVVLLAEQWSENSRADLRATFVRRATEWRFDWAFWQWTGDRLETLDAGRTGHASEPSNASAWETIDIPNLRATAGRSSNRSIDELRALADERGVADLFDHFIAAAVGAGHRATPNKEVVAIRVKGIPGYRTPATVFSAYVARSAPGRFAVGCWPSAFAAAPSDLPGHPTRDKFGGHQEDNRYLSCSAEIDRLFSVPLRVSGSSDSA